MIKPYTKDISKDNYILFFANSDCFPCKLLEEEIKDLSIDIYRVNISEDLKIAQDFDVLSIPTLIFMKNNIKVYTTSGVRNLKDLNKILQHFHMI